MKMCKINLQGWPFPDASFSSLRPPQPPDSSWPRRTAGAPAESPAPSLRRRRQQLRPAAATKAADEGPSPGILLSWLRSSRKAPHTPKTASAARTYWSPTNHSGAGAQLRQCQATTTLRGSTSVALEGASVLKWRSGDRTHHWLTMLPNAIIQSRDSAWLLATNKRAGCCFTDVAWRRVWSHR